MAAPSLLEPSNNCALIICPFHRLLPLVPRDSSCLDVGCGSGLFLGLLARRGIKQGIGFDVSENAIKLASTVRGNLPLGLREGIQFKLVDNGGPWPKGSFDVVCMVDVMHHIAPTAQQEVFLLAVSNLVPGGIFLYKDMADRPAIFALANRLHDLVMARQWINYVPLSQVKAWGKAAGLHLEHESKLRMLWYVHEWVTFKKPFAPYSSTPIDKPLDDTNAP